MNRTNLTTCCCLATAACIAQAIFSAPSWASSVSVVEVDNGGVIGVVMDMGGTSTYDFLLESPGKSIVSQQVRVVLSSGVLMEHEFGGDTPPNEDLFISFASLKYDSFAASGGPTSDWAVPEILGMSDELNGPGGPAPETSWTGWDVKWAPEAGLDTTGAEDFLAARLSLSQLAFGELHFQATFSDGSKARLVDVPIAGGRLSVVPEPATLWLLALAGGGWAAVARQRRAAASAAG